jgi:tRNA (guanosine-2'-O-)-methyltransferase
MPRSDRRVERVRSVLSKRQPDLTLVLENIHDPHNVSAIFRSCDAVGVMGVELVYTREKFPHIGKKSSSSAYKWVAHRNHRSINECYTALREQGFMIVASRLDGASRSLYELDLTAKTAIVFGNEHRGVSDDAADRADNTFQIPMMGMIQSLNVSVAAAVCLYEALRQRLKRGIQDGPNMSDEVFRRLCDEWITR